MKSTKRGLGTIGELLARFGCLPDLGYGRVVFRDERGRRTLLHVRPTSTGVVLVLPGERLMAFTNLEAGHLRGCIRHASHLVDPLPGVDRLPSGASWKDAA